MIQQETRLEVTDGDAFVLVGFVAKGHIFADMFN